MTRAGELPDIPGVCSSWLRGLVEGDGVFVYRKKNAVFKPTVGDGGMVMIGAGTGVAPFLGFLDHLAESTAKTRAVLITGNRYEELDSIYGNEFTEHHLNGTLDTYLTAYSRDENSTCKYVQDVIGLHDKDIVNYVEEGARVYVCGDAKGLSVGVYEMFCKVLSRIKGFSEAEAREMIAKMKKDGRYCEDIWS